MPFLLNNCVVWVYTVHYIYNSDTVPIMNMHCGIRVEENILCVLMRTW